jgi:hypothetical protein
MDPRLLSPATHREQETRADLALLRDRDALVRARMLMVNHVRGACPAPAGKPPERVDSMLAVADVLRTVGVEPR